MDSRDKLVEEMYSQVGTFILKVGAGGALYTLREISEISRGKEFNTEVHS